MNGDIVWKYVLLVMAYTASLVLGVGVLVEGGKAVPWIVVLLTGGLTLFYGWLALEVWDER